MKFDDLIVLIPAIKKSVAFEDDLIRKLNGVSLIQRTISKACSLVSNTKKVFVITDSEEIKLVAGRNQTNCFFDNKLIWKQTSIQGRLLEYIKNNARNHKLILIISPYAPLLRKKTLTDAITKFSGSDEDLLKPITFKKFGATSLNEKSPLSFLFKIRKKNFSLTSESFSLIRSKLIFQNREYKPKISNFEINYNLSEINSYEDWWICEKLLQRKKILIRVVGDKKLGLGHVFRCLSIAHEITDHSIEFITTKNNQLAIQKLAKSGYSCIVSTAKAIERDILNYNPDLVLNDILNTSEPYVVKLKKNKIKIVNFEDLGLGAKFSTLTINELYDKPLIRSGNILWGNKYFFLRDEFNDARKNRWNNAVKSLLLTFGGTDQNNYSQIIYSEIKEFCKENNIFLNIVTGPGYKHFDKLNELVSQDDNAMLTRSTGIISSIMETCQLAIISNGRTVYELAHMNIPAIVISHHIRETTHKFSCAENGFVSVGIFEKGETEKIVKQELESLVFSASRRKKLQSKMKKFDFIKNKKKIIRKISNILKSEEKKKDAAI